MWIVVFLGTQVALSADPRFVPVQAPRPFTFHELERLAIDDPPSGALAGHLSQVLSEPTIDNAATFAGTLPHQPVASGIKVLRVAEWNINRGVNFDGVLSSLSKDSRFVGEASTHLSRSAQKQLIQELHLLRSADVIVLDEVDDGMKRTGYRNVAQSLARELHFNYAYGVEFIELNKIYLRLKHLDRPPGTRTLDRAKALALDPDRYLGFEGTAILSRYPIVRARNTRLPDCYDWYHGEIKQVSDLEYLRRWSAETIFDEQIRRQVRRGGRMALIADLAVPGATGDRVTIVAPHLEDYCAPGCRTVQMDGLLRQIQNTPNDVVVAGDLNTTGRDGTPVSLQREILKRVTSWRFWGKEALFWFLPVPFAGLIDVPVNYFKNYHDPTAVSIPLILPNRERQLFDSVRLFRFRDMGQFDFAGNPHLAAKHKGHTLSDTNQRSWKGFVPTFSFNKTYWHLVGSYKLDWFFAKCMHSQSELAGPRAGRALREVNTALGYRISDHAPSTVDLPLN